MYVLEQALQQAFLEEQAAYPQEQPALSPDFRERMMALNRQHLLTVARRKIQLRRWICAAAAVVLIATVSLTGAYSWVQRQNRPKTMYTISQLPESYTQFFQQTSPHTSCTMWSSNGSSIVLIQEENSLESLMQQTYMYQMKQEVHTAKLDGRLYVNVSDGRMILVWRDGKYSFLLTMDGELNQAEQLIRTAENLKVV
ncbi:MAG: hypothetical protein IJY28_03770 [Clostridia bacterium]|nr:hypothetical protein [Clostridia bacterium]